MLRLALISSQQHHAFLVDEHEFDQIFARIRDQHLSYWADPYRRKHDEINTWDGGRGVYFDDPNGHLLEVLTRPYGSGGTTTSRPHPLFARTQGTEDPEGHRADYQEQNGGANLATAERPDVRGIAGR